MSDLRTIKTQKAIEEAFLKLRAKYDLEKIKVSQLCELAMINKTTFYNYYVDIYELSDVLEKKYFEESFFGFDGYNCLVQDPEKFILGVYYSFIKNDTIQLLFNNRINILVEKAQRYVLKYYKKDINSEELKMRVLFLIQGGFYILFNYKAKEEDKLKIIVEMAKYIIKK